jgi:hypothetical protein
MILFRYKWRWDSASMQITKNFCWKILREAKWDFDDDDPHKMPLLFAENEKVARALAKLERAVISGVKEVDNFKDLKAKAIADYKRELKNVCNNKFDQNDNDQNRPLGLDRNRASHKGRLESARDQLLLLFGMRGADTGATH